MRVAANNTGLGSTLWVPYLHTLIIKGCPDKHIDKIVACVQDWSFKKSQAGVLNGLPAVVKDKQPLVCTGNKAPKTTSIIYVNFVCDGLFDEFIDMIQRKAAEYASAMYCIRQNDAKKSDETMYPLRLECDDNLALHGLSQAFDAYGKNYLHKSAKNREVVYVNYVDFTHVTDIMHDYATGVFHPESLQGSNWKMYPVKLSLFMFELHRMQEQHGETHQKDGFIMREDLETWFLQSGKEFVLADIIDMYKPMAKQYYGYDYDEERSCFRNMGSAQSHYEGLQYCAAGAGVKHVAASEQVSETCGNTTHAVQSPDTTIKPDNRAWARVAAGLPAASKIAAVAPGQAVMSIKSQSFVDEKPSKPLSLDKTAASMTPSDQGSDIKSAVLSTVAGPVSSQVAAPALASTQAKASPVGLVPDLSTVSAPAAETVSAGMCQDMGPSPASSGVMSRDTMPLCAPVMVPSSGALMVPSASAYPLYAVEPMIANNNMNMFVFNQQQLESPNQKYALYTKSAPTGFAKNVCVNERLSVRMNKVELCMYGSEEYHQKRHSLCMVKRIERLEKDCGVHIDNNKHTVVNRICMIESQVY